MAALRLTEVLLASVLARSHTTSSEETTATAMPKTESMTPNFPRCTRRKAWFPTIRPITPQECGHTQHGHQGHRRAGRGGMDLAHGHRRQYSPQKETAHEPSIGQDLDNSPEPQPLDGSQHHQADDHEVDRVHGSAHDVVGARREHRRRRDESTDSR